jgi:hypothetical protein
VAQDTALVVDHVAVAAADPFGLLDYAVESFGAGVGGVLGKGDLGLLAAVSGSFRRAKIPS